ncbi:MAG: hypothetical protein CMJ84_05290 [Planctomycetes bacterium]|jgi:hypothetical protein|nr:hypothetical protein [Planctomycetota bacterium]MDP6408147.1 FG-GAP-like repeat-containing protein [Planctomycetota bacterium]
MRFLCLPLLLLASCWVEDEQRAARSGVVHAAAQAAVAPSEWGLDELVSPAPAPGARFGHAAVALDFNGDGEQDIAVAAPGEPAVYLFYGPGLTWWRRFAPPEGRSGDFGHDLAVGELDGAPGDDLVIAAPKTERAGDAAAGAVYVLTHGRDLPTPLRVRAEAGALLGTSVALGDFNGDGAPEVACGAPKQRIEGQQSGAVFFLCPSKGTEWVVANPIGAWKHGNFGHDLAVADTNADGKPDLLVSALGNPSASGVSGAGQVFVLRNPIPGGEVIAVEDPGATEGDGARFGMSIFARDVNGDGNADLLVGAPRKNGGGVEDAGQGFLFFGPAFTAEGHRAFLRPAAKAHDVLGFRALAADVVGDTTIDVLFCSLARHQDMAIVAWDGSALDAPPRIWAPPSDAGHHFVQGLAHGPRLNGAENLLVGDPSFARSGQRESGRVLIRRLDAIP